jgi:hypothetical protein
VFLYERPQGHQQPDGDAHQHNDEDFRHTVFPAP